MIGRKVGELLPGVGADKPRLSDVGFIWRDLPSPPAPGGTGPLAPCSVCTSPHSSSYSAGSPPGWGSPDCSPARPQFQPRRQSSCWRWEIWVEATLSDRTAAGRMSWRRCLISPAGSSWWSRWAELRSGCWRDSTLQRKKDKCLPGSARKVVRWWRSDIGKIPGTDLLRRNTSQIFNLNSQRISVPPSSLSDMTVR